MHVHKSWEFAFSVTCNAVLYDSFSHFLTHVGPVAVKKLNVANPTEQQMQAFKNEVGVLR